jgi:uncharacterized protein YcbX
MNAKAIGEIIQINRYPVKSLAGEALNSVQVRSYGLLGDRCYAFVDPTKSGWERYITARQIPELLSYKAELDIQSTVEGYPQLKITRSDGHSHQWDEHFQQEIQQRIPYSISTERFNINAHEQLAVDDGSILIITDRSLKRIEQALGKPVDERRFRANFMIQLYDDVDDDESSYIGKQLIVGNVKLDIQSLCQRCTMVTIHPDNLESDPTLLKSISENMNLNFGMYADVVRVGMVQVGDIVYAAI